MDRACENPVSPRTRGSRRLARAMSWDWIPEAFSLRAADTPFALVTVVAHKGSVPRGAGAKLIALADGRFFGTIGGGRLEQLVLEDARRALEQALSEPRRYPLCPAHQSVLRRRGGSIHRDRGIARPSMFSASGTWVSRCVR